MSLEAVRGPRRDEFDCFNIRDFRKNDSIIVDMSHTGRVRGVVSSVDEETNLITFTTSSGEYVTDINSIVFLDDYRRGWIEQGTRR